MSDSIASTLDLTLVDTDHLTRQALKLFGKRYGKLYDTLVAVIDKDCNGYVTYNEFVTFRLKGYSEEHIPEAKKSTDTSWLALTGGNSPTEVNQLSRQKCVELCLLGYHSKDQDRVQMLKETLTSVNKFQFDLMDTNKDGFISKEEYELFTEKRGCKDSWKGAFQAIDLDGDGRISRDEWLKCALGCFFDVGEERYHHVHGQIKD